MKSNRKTAAASLLSALALLILPLTMRFAAIPADASGLGGRVWQSGSADGDVYEIEPGDRIDGRYLGTVETVSGSGQVEVFFSLKVNGEEIALTADSAEPPFVSDERFDMYGAILTASADILPGSRIEARLETLNLPKDYNSGYQSDVTRIPLNTTNAEAYITTDVNHFEILYEQGVRDSYMDSSRQEWVLPDPLSVGYTVENGVSEVQVCLCTTGLYGEGLYLIFKLSVKEDAAPVPAATVEESGFSDDGEEERSDDDSEWTPDAAYINEHGWDDRPDGIDPDAIGEWLSENWPAVAAGTGGLIVIDRIRKGRKKKKIARAGKKSQEQPHKILTDPATGAQRGFHYDGDSDTWISDDGSTMLDPDRVAEWEQRRAATRKAIREDAENVRTGKTRTAMDSMLEEIDRKSAEEAGKLPPEEKEREKKWIMKRMQLAEEYSATVYSHYGDEMALLENIASFVSNAADVAIDSMSKYVPGGKGVKIFYVTGKNFGQNLAEYTVSDGKVSLGAAVLKATGHTLTELGQAEAKGIGFCRVMNIGGETAMGAMDAALDGGDVLTGSAQGLAKGLVKEGVSALGDKYMPDPQKAASYSGRLAELKNTSEASIEQAKGFSDLLSQKSVNNLVRMRNARYISGIQEILADQAADQLKTAGVNIAREAVPNVADKLGTGAVDHFFGD